MKITERSFQNFHCSSSKHFDEECIQTQTAKSSPFFTFSLLWKKETSGRRGELRMTRIRAFTGEHGSKVGGFMF